jgi:CBS domain-containing protein
MKVKDVMHKGVDWVSPDTPVTELAKLMREHDRHSDWRERPADRYGDRPRYRLQRAGGG